MNLINMMGSIESYLKTKPDPTSVIELHLTGYYDTDTKYEKPDPNTIQKFISFIHKCSHLEIFVMKNFRMSFSQWTNIINELPMSQLIKLDISDNETSCVITRFNALHFMIHDSFVATVFHNMEHMRALDLSNSTFAVNISQSLFCMSVRHLQRFLCKTTTLTHLILYCCVFSDDSITDLAMGLARNRSIQYLLIDKKLLKKRQIINAIAHNSSIRYVTTDNHDMIRSKRNDIRYDLFTRVALLLTTTTSVLMPLEMISIIISWLDIPVYYDGLFKK